MPVKKAVKISKPGGFRRAYMMLPHGEIKTLKEKIMNDCSWGYWLFEKKSRGAVPYTNLEMLYLQEFFAEYGLDAWTGEKILTTQTT